MIKQRVVWLDVLRIFSAFLIVCIHVSSHYVEKLLSYGSVGWVCADIYLALCRCAVPVFVMISGAVFLNPEKDISLKLIYRKYIWHLLTVLLAWASVHFVVVDVWLGQTPSASWGSVYFMSVVTYWFLPMIMGLYALSPVFRAVVSQSNKKLLAYSVGLGLVWGVLAPVV
ncbi:MAG: acyltransferase family protein, partial [Elusimicrobiales bacterium]|nr:acyltransferase family protein [Elusimicrobiales bacterium]